MAAALTCPHCESALTLSEGQPAARVRCPQCGATFPHPLARGLERDPDRIAQATAPENDAWQQFSQRHLGRVRLLSGFGAVAAWIGVMMSLPRIVQATDSAVGGPVFLGATLAIFGLSLCGIHWSRHAQRWELQMLGWIITGIFAIIGSLGLAVLLVLASARCVPVP